jgi:hypothetical protein
MNNSGDGVKRRHHPSHDRTKSGQKNSLQAMAQRMSEPRG